MSTFCRPIASGGLAAFLLAGCGAPKADVRVGVSYFAGWWREAPNKYAPTGRDWRADFPGRVALLGEYDEQETMDREIRAAAEYGVDFFLILWYPPPDHGAAGGAEPDPQTAGRRRESERLDGGLRRFMASPECGRLRFAIEYVNHPPFAIESDAAWEAACREWASAMAHSSYLRLGGRPVFKVHGLALFAAQNGGDPTRVSARLDALRRAVRETAGSEPLVGGGVGAFELPDPRHAAPYDFLGTYMDVPPLPKRETPYPYADLMGTMEESWAKQAASAARPYVPCLPAGWDPRPWRDPRASFAAPTREEWTAALRRVKAALDASPRLGIPDGHGGRVKAFTMYAWNEFGEGGFVAPTRGEGTMKLEGIRDVFGGR